jgi:hypothetical protein
MTKKPAVLLGVGWCVAIVALLFGVCRETAAAPLDGSRNGLRLVVDKIAPGQTITDHDWGFVRLEIGVETEKRPIIRKGGKSQRNRVEIRVDGKEARCQLIESRSGYEGKKAFSYRTLGLPLGEPGPHSVRVTVGRQSKTIPVVFEPSGQFDISGLCNDQAVFGKKDLEFQWFGSYLIPETIRASVNGREIPVEVSGADERLHLLEGRLGPIGKIEPGTNTLTLEGTDALGGRTKKSVAFHYYPDNRITVGDTFVLNVGIQEPAGKPYFQVSVEGLSVKKGDEMRGRTCPERLGGETVLPAGKAVLVRFEALAPGESTIRTSEKRHRTDPLRETGSFKVLVQTSAQARRIEKARTGGLTLKWTETPGLFGCLIPEGWVVTRNPGEDRKILGVSVYREGQGDTGGIGPKLVVEFYPPDNGAGLRTAEDFVAAVSEQGRHDREEPPTAARDLEGARQEKRFERNVKLAVKTPFFFTRPVRVSEEYTVIPGRTGFYVISSRAPLHERPEMLVLFDAVVGSFEPLR